MLGRLVELIQPIIRHRGAVGLAGLIILAGLLVLLQILRLSVFSPIDEAGTYGLLTLIVKSVFWLSITAVVVSGLAYVLPAELFMPVSAVEYCVGVYRMFDPSGDDGHGAFTDAFEPFPSFPYYSPESDHPSYWPARVIRERSELGERYRRFFEREDVRDAFAAGRERTEDPNSVHVLGSGRDDEALDAATLVSQARMFFNLHLDSDYDALAASVGADIAAEFMELEAAREDLRRWIPNRIAVLRLRNAGSRTVRKVTIEYDVAGYVYDTKVRALAETEQDPNLPFEHRLEIPRLLAGQGYDIAVWYIYQSVAERAFPDKINYIQELTQGFTITNFAVETGGRTVFRSRLLKKYPAYDRLYIGDGRQAKNPHRAIVRLLKAQAKETRAALDEADKTRKTARGMTLPELEQFEISEHQVENVWVSLRSEAGHGYRAVCVYEHPNGPYILVSTEHGDADELSRLADALAVAFSGEAEGRISDRSDDICTTVRVPGGFSRTAIVEGFSAVEQEGFDTARVERLHYATDAAAG